MVDVARAAFNQADINRDGVLDQGEFSRFASGGLGGAGGAGASYGVSAGYGSGVSGGYSSSSSYESSGAYGGGLDAGLGVAGGVGLVGGAGYGVAGGLGGGATSYEESSYSSSTGGLGGAYGAGVSVGGGYGSASSYDASYTSGGVGGAYGVDTGVVGIGSGVGVGGGIGVAGGVSGLTSDTTVVQRYQTDAQGLFVDSNPQIIRRPAPSGPQTYTQNIRVRFLQPPPIPPPGPLIIKEVRPPQPPAPPPLRIRQQAPPLPTPPPLVLRERPPPVPQSVAAQTVIRRLAALPVPPRSVIIERLPPLPPRPRDIIIERWIPYGAQAKRRTIVQRASAAQQYAAPRNIIIQYEPVQVRVVRQFQRLGVVSENPSAYVARYGAALLDAGSLVAQARAAGVVEDITPPLLGGGVAVGYGASSYGQDLTLGGGVGGGVGLAVDAGAGLGGGVSSYSEQSYSSSTGGLGLDAGLAGVGAVGGGLVGGGVVGGGALGVDAGLGGGYSSYSSSSEYSSGGGLGGGYSVSGGYGVGGGYGVDVAGAAFNQADANRDGVIDRSEFRSFAQQG